MRACQTITRSKPLAATVISVFLAACGPAMIQDDSGMQGNGIAEHVRQTAYQEDDEYWLPHTRAWIAEHCVIKDGATAKDCGERIGMTCANTAFGVHCSYKGYWRSRMMEQVLFWKIPMKQRRWWRRTVEIEMAFEGAGPLAVQRRTVTEPE